MNPKCQLFSAHDINISKRFVKNKKKHSFHIIIIMPDYLVV